MATIRAAWKRTVRVREYESETLEFAVERDWDEVNDGDPVRAVAILNRELAREGDALVLERLTDRTASGIVVPLKKSGKSIEPDRVPRVPAGSDEFV